MPFASLLLPQRRHMVGNIPSDAVKRALARADHSQSESGERAQLQRYFDVDAPSWPVAALTRSIDVAADLGAFVWVRADPAWIQPDMVGARLMAYGPGVHPTAADAIALLPALNEIFAGAGLAFDAPVASRWYVRVPLAEVVPQLAMPEYVLGADILAHLPEGEGSARWRQLFTQAQMILHHHPCNQRRQVEGKPPINALWFWGEGKGPLSVRTPYLQVRSRDALLRGLARASGIDDLARPHDHVKAIVDLRHLRSLTQIGRQALSPLIEALNQRQLDQLLVDFQDGVIFRLSRRQRWRIWRCTSKLME